MCYKLTEPEVLCKISVLLSTLLINLILNKFFLRLSQLFWLRFNAKHSSLIIKHQGKVSINRALNCTHKMASDYFGSLQCFTFLSGARKVIIIFGMTDNSILLCFGFCPNYAKPLLPWRQPMFPYFTPVFLRFNCNVWHNNS